jgi:hypothetical protein
MEVTSPQSPQTDAPVVQSPGENNGDEDKNEGEWETVSGRQHKTKRSLTTISKTSSTNSRIQGKNQSTGIRHPKFKPR